MVRRGQRCWAVLVVAGVFAVAACSSDASDGAGRQPVDRTTSSTAAPATAEPARLEVRGSTYVVPDPLPAGEPGDVLATASRPPTDRLGRADRTLLLYRSATGAGEPTAVSAVLLVPPGEAPAGGWPLISWGHGTTGVADVCAPSLTDNLFYNEYAQEAAAFLEAGYAVVASDYVGLGTPGMHSYLVAADEGNAMVDAVTAARAVEPDLSADWFTVGHSQGGQAVLAATRAAGRSPNTRLRAAVAIAPASTLEAALPAVLADTAPADLVYGIYALAGLSTVRPGLDLSDVLGPEGRSRLDLLTETGCLLDTAAELRGVDVADIFALEPEAVAALSDALGDAADPDREPTVGPVLVVQGATDLDVPEAITAGMVARLQALGSDVTYRPYAGLNHDEVLGPSMCDVRSWLADHGGVPVADCTPQPTDLS